MHVTLSGGLEADVLRVADAERRAQCEVFAMIQHEWLGAGTKRRYQDAARERKRHSENERESEKERRREKEGKWERQAVCGAEAATRNQEWYMGRHESPAPRIPWWSWRGGKSS